jgi:hypothetical protein
VSHQTKGVDCDTAPLCTQTGTTGPYTICRLAISAEALKPVSGCGRIIRGAKAGPWWTKYASGGQPSIPPVKLQGMIAKKNTALAHLISRAGRGGLVSAGRDEWQLN